MVNGISVVMATNRVDHYLNESVTSLFSDDEINIELVLVLDGITVPPNPPAWLTDSRVKIILNEKSRGLGAALNLGIRAATFDVIARLDSDDNTLSGRFQLQLDQLNSSLNPVLVGGKIRLIDEGGRHLGSPTQVCGPDVRRSLFLQNVVPHSTYMFRKSIAFEVGLYDEKLLQMEDYDFLLRMSQRGPVSVICREVVDYRIHSGQMSKKANWRANYVQSVMRQRRELAKAMNVSVAEVTVKNLIWEVAQISRSLGLTKPRHQMWLKKPSINQDSDR